MAADKKIDWSTPENANVLDAFMAQVDAIHVPTLSYAEGVREMEWMRRRARRGEGSCLIVGGRSGSGKSWLLKRNLLEHEFTQNLGPYVDPLPVISVEAPSPGDTKGLAAKLLAAVTGHAVSTYDSESVLLDRFEKLALKRGLKVIKIDEFQHVLDRMERKDRTRNKTKEKVASENIKSKINTAPFQWILSGEPQVLSFFNEWEQFESRGKTLPLRPFAWPADEGEFAAFLDGYDEQLTALDFKRKSGLAGIVARFQLATAGFHGKAVRRLLKDSAESAFMARDPDISAALPVTFERWKRLGDRENPFLMEEREVRRRLGSVERKPAVATSQPAIRGTGKGLDTSPSFGL